MTQLIARARTMRQDPRTREAHLLEAVACPRCGAIHPHGGVACAECGALLAGLPARRTEKAAKERREATRALRRGYRRMNVVSWIYRAGALAYSAVTLIAVLALVRPDVPLVPGMVVVGLTTLLAVLMIVGALRFPFGPYVWTLIVASLATVVAVAHLIGPNPMGLMFFWTAAWAVAFWATLASTRGFRKLIEQYTDEYVLHLSSLRTQRSIRSQPREDRHERLMGVLRKASGRAWKLSAAAAVAISLASVVGTTAVVSGLRPQALDASRAGFEAAWNRGDFAAVAGFFPVQTREWQSEWLRGMVVGHGWEGSPPRLDGARVRRHEDHAWLDYDLGGLALSTGWVLQEREWRLFEVELPEPPLEPVLAQFVEAWRRSDLEAIAAFFPAGYQERWYDSLARSAGHRSWETLPEILATETSTTAEGEVVVTLRLEAGEVRTKWLFRRDGSWGLQGLQFPKLRR